MSLTAYMLPVLPPSPGARTPDSRPILDPAPVLAFGPASGRVTLVFDDAYGNPGDTRPRYDGGGYSPGIGGGGSAQKVPSKLNDLADVKTSPQDAAGFFYNSALGIWQNRAVAAVALSGAYGDLTGTPSAADGFGLLVVAPANGEYLLNGKVPYDLTLTELLGVCVSGTATLDLRIGGTLHTGVSLSGTAALRTWSPGLNLVAGNSLALVFSNVSACTKATITINGHR